MSLYVITGAPLTGKSTWVRERAVPGDVVVDLDRIAQAMTAEATDLHDYPVNIRRASMRVRPRVVREAVNHAHRGDSYVIHTNPSEQARRFYAQHAAQLVELSAPLDVIQERAAAERPPGYLNRVAVDFWRDDEA